MLKYLKSPFVLLIIAVGVAVGIFAFGKTPKKKLDLSVVGYINMRDGLGRQGPELLLAFKDDMNTNFHVTRKIKGAKRPKGFKKYIAEDHKDWGKVVIFEDLLWEPFGNIPSDRMRHCPSKSIKIAYSMYESTRIPQEWVDILNKQFDAVVVPSEFLIEAYQVSGVKIPIYVIPLALDFATFFEQPLKEDSNETFVFGNFSAGTDRKNHVNLIRAFHQAFGHDPSVKLVMNARYCEKEVRNAITKELAKVDARNIKFTQSPLSKEDYLTKYGEIDCYVSPSKGEGFSIQPREAMALGIPVIATDNTGQEDICRTGLISVVQTPIPELALNPWGDYYGNNFNCNVDDLAQAMVEMRDSHENYLSNSKQARQWARGFLFEELKEYYRSFIKPKKVVLGMENKITTDYIMTNSLELFFKYKRAFGSDICESANENVFTFIYKSGEWGVNENGEGFSGDGSTLESAETYMKVLTQFIEEHEIKSVVDLGCGDWTFSQHINWDHIDYTGVDVVKFLVEQNQEKFGAPNIRFIHADGTNFELPEADLFICKDVMQHLSNRDVRALVKQLGKFKHCLITNDIDTSVDSKINPNIQSGACRCLDLTQAPFSLKGERLLEYDSDETHKLVLHISNK